MTEPCVGAFDISGTATAEGETLAHAATPISAAVSFSHGFPTPGRYRAFIQMKHGSTVETGVFDVCVR